MKKVLAILLTLFIILALLPVSALAISSDDFIDLDDSVTTQGTGWSYSDMVFTVTGDVTITGATTENRVVVQPGADVNVILDNANIVVSDCSFSMAGATVNLTLVGANILNSNGTQGQKAGLEVSAGSTLVIGGTGSLAATGKEGAGIGGSGYFNDCGNISITGGVITANGGSGGAGIGGSNGGGGGTISISGGEVTAKGGLNGGAGIGGGNGSEGGGACGTVTISGGTVTATAGSFLGGSGIGGGNSSMCSGSITIDGGIVKATGYRFGAGIESSDIVINNGNVTAKGTRNAGISGDSITINGGAVTANGDGSAAGIGGGIAPSGGNGQRSGNITINGGSVTAIGGNGNTTTANRGGNGGGAGIGGGGGTADTSSAHKSKLGGGVSSIIINIPLASSYPPGENEVYAQGGTGSGINYKGGKGANIGYGGSSGDGADAPNASDGTDGAGIDGIINPENKTVNVTNSTTFNAGVIPTEECLLVPAVQWQISTDNGKTWKDVEDSNSSNSGIYILTATSLSMNGNLYRNEITITNIIENDTGSIKLYTKPAMLTVNAAVVDTLATLITQAKAIEKNGYSDATWNTLQAAITDAQNIVADADVSQAQVDSQIADLQKAIDGLRKNPLSLWEKIIEFIQKITKWLKELFKFN